VIIRTIFLWRKRPGNVLIPIQGVLPRIRGFIVAVLIDSEAILTTVSQGDETKSVNTLKKGTKASFSSFRSCLFVRPSVLCPHFSSPEPLNGFFGRLHRKLLGEFNFASYRSNITYTVPHDAEI
jgi:hypothetical protein